MRANLNKAMIVSAIAVPALLVSACGSTEPAETVDNSTVTELPATDAMEGTTNDAMTNTDAATGDAGAMADNATDAMANGTDAMANGTDAMAEDKMEK